MTHEKQMAINFEVSHPNDISILLDIFRMTNLEIDSHKEGTAYEFAC